MYSVKQKPTFIEGFDVFDVNKEWKEFSAPATMKTLS